MIDTIKLFLVTAISGLIAYIEPVHSAMVALIFVFSIDIVCGIFKVLFVCKKRIKPKKILASFIYVAIYLSIIASVYIIGVNMDDASEAIFVDKFITYVFIYFYITNILKNLKALVPKSKAISFLDYVFHLEMLKRIPNLSEYLNKDKNKEQAQEE